MVEPASGTVPGFAPGRLLVGGARRSRVAPAKRCL